MRTLADRLRERAAERFVGRTAELALIDESLAAEVPPVAVFVVHGPGGIGKTTLLERARGLAAARGIDSLRLDARDIEPSPAGLLGALGGALGLDGGDVSLAAVLDRWRQAPRRLLLIDTFERASNLDGWLRQVLLPALPETTVVLIAGRAAPDPAWTTDALWREGARVLALRELAPADCARLLAARGIAAPLHAHATALSWGHPLALTLLADEAAARGALPPQLGEDIVRRLVERFTADAPTDRHRQALEVCALARATTVALLADTVDAAQAQALYDWLEAQSFVESGADGLFPHDLVRDAIDDALHRRQREHHRALRRAVHRHLVQRIGHGTRDAARLVFDMMFLMRRVPSLRPFVDFGALGSLWFERGGAADLPALQPLLQAELPPAQHDAFAHWLAHPATTAWVARERPGQVAGITLSIDLAALDDAQRASDPVLAAVWRALQPRAQPHDQQLLARWNVVGGGQGRSAAMNTLQVSQLFQWLTLPRLGTFVICVERPERWQSFMQFVRYERLAGCDVELDGTPLGCYAHDWRAEPPARFFQALQARSLGQAPALIDRRDFEQAVRDALRQLGDAAALAANPLAGGAAVRAAARDGEAPAATLQRLLRETAQALSSNPREAKFWRALELTYFRPAGSQELAAERLGLPFGTYRYQLATGIERLVERLWALETG